MFPFISSLWIIFLYILSKHGLAAPEQQASRSTVTNNGTKTLCDATTSEINQYFNKIEGKGYLLKSLRSVSYAKVVTAGQSNCRPRFPRPPTTTSLHTLWHQLLPLEESQLVAACTSLLRTAADKTRVKRFLYLHLSQEDSAVAEVMLSLVATFHESMNWSRTDEDMFVKMAIDPFLDAVFQPGEELVRHGSSIF
ncbi:hypothetical protein PS15p_208198 [Mucor circinelloides]